MVSIGIGLQAGLVAAVVIVAIAIAPGAVGTVVGLRRRRVQDSRLERSEGLEKAADAIMWTRSLTLLAIPLTAVLLVVYVGLSLPIGLIIGGLLLTSFASALTVRRDADRLRSEAAELRSPK